MKKYLWLLLTVLLLVSVPVIATVLPIGREPTPSPVDSVLNITLGKAFGTGYAPGVAVIEGKKGRGPGEFGITLDGEPRGPQSFTVDGQGNIYILDQINSRVQVFGENGLYLREIAVPSSADTISVDGAGNVFVLDQTLGTISVYGPSGDKQSTIELPRDIQNVTAMFVDAGKVAVEVGHGVLYNLDLSTVPSSFKPMVGRPSPIGNLAARAVVAGSSKEPDEGNMVSPRSAQIEVRTEGSVNTLTVNTDRPYRWISTVAGDRNQDLFLGFFSFIESGPPEFRNDSPQYDVIRISPSGGLLDQVVLPESQYLYILHPVVVAESGDIYQFQSTADSVRVVKWALKTSQIGGAE